MKNDVTYIYSLEYPEGNIRYIGKSNNIKDRFKVHIRGARDNCKNYKDCWIKGLLDNGKIPIMNILDNVNINEWQFWEKFYISLFKSWGFKLTNLTNGGDGIGGYIMPIETKNKIREKLTGENNGMFGKIGELHHNFGKQSNLGFKHSQETKNYLRDINLGKKVSDETKKKIGDSRRGEKNFWFGKKGVNHPLSGRVKEKNPFYNKSHSEESINKIKTKYRLVKKVKCDHCGKLFHPACYKNHINSLKNK